MRLMPAIDLKNGRCVRLVQGMDDAETIYGDDPVAVARGWADQGAEWLHIVNLDGAFGRASGNPAILQQIVRSRSVKIEFGGGLRTESDVDDALAMGVEKVVLGTMAFDDRDGLARILRKHGARHVVIALDTKGGVVATKGWTSSSGVNLVQAAQEFEKSGVREVLYTDVERDGMLTGPDMAGLEALISETSLNVIASGGIGSLSDLSILGTRQWAQLSGVIVGKALYERKFTYAEAVQALQSRSSGEERTNLAKGI